LHPSIGDQLPGVDPAKLGQLAKAAGDKALPLIDGLVKRDVDDVVKKVAPKTFFGKSVDDLSKAGRVLDPADKSGQFTKAGRSLTKHQAGARAGSTKFPKAKGSPATINQQAQGVLDDILNNPGTKFNQGHRPRFGDTIEAIAPDGRGVVFDAKGNFLFFGEF